MQRHERSLVGGGRSLVGGGLCDQRYVSLLAVFATERQISSEAQLLCPDISSTYPMPGQFHWSECIITSPCYNLIGHGYVSLVSPHAP